MTFSTEINSRFGRWAQSASERAESVTSRAGLRARQGLMAAARRVEQATRMTDGFASAGAQLGQIALRGSRELAACNLSISRGLLVGARKRLESAAAAPTLADAWRGQTETLPATRKLLSAGLRAYRDSLGKTFDELKHYATTALRAKASPKVATGRKHRLRKPKATSRKTNVTSR